MVKCLPVMLETQVQSWVGKIPWRRKWQPILVLLPGKVHGLRILVGYSTWGRKESDTTERLHFTSEASRIWVGVVVLWEGLMGEHALIEKVKRRKKQSKTELLSNTKYEGLSLFKCCLLLIVFSYTKIQDREDKKKNPL